MSGKSSNGKSAGHKAFVAPFRVDGTKSFELSGHPTADRGGIDKDDGKDIIEANRKRLQNLQEVLYAQDRWSLLLIFQGMDAAGKDSAIKAVFDGVNPQGCEVTSFKQPSSNELDHDFMWRSTVKLPQRGRIGIFNRSYYEECLVVRVHPEVLANQKLPAELVTADIWKDRFEDISAFEKYLARNGTVVLKFFLNVSKEEQRQRFLDRLDEPSKNWKFSMADVAERALWEEYQAAYQDMIANTATTYAPWIVVPADHKWFARVVIGSAIVDALETLDLKVPGVDAESLKAFAEVRTVLEREGNGKKPAVKPKLATPPMATAKPAPIKKLAVRKAAPRKPRVAKATVEKATIAKATEKTSEPSA